MRVGQWHHAESKCGLGGRGIPPSARPAEQVAAVPTLADAISGAQNVVVAVPVPVVHGVIESIVPLLDGTQLVMDVGSVKVRPIQAMSELLGADYPWVGTHPLFGWWHRHADPGGEAGARRRDL